MTKGRKTVEVEVVKRYVNNYLNSEGTTPSSRKGVASLLEAVLLDTDNYCGYCYMDGNLGKTDETRRRYY
jgi:hypothetical protein